LHFPARAVVLCYFIVNAASLCVSPRLTACGWSAPDKQQISFAHNLCVQVAMKILEQGNRHARQ
jgi:hypothetical protein